MTAAIQAALFQPLMKIFIMHRSLELGQVMELPLDDDLQYVSFLNFAVIINQQLVTLELRITGTFYPLKTVSRNGNLSWKEARSIREMSNILFARNLT